MPQTTTASVIEAARVAEQRSQAWLASRLGISRSTMGRKLDGDVDFYVEELIAAAIALHLDPSDVIRSLAESSAA